MFGRALAEVLDLGKGGLSGGSNMEGRGFIERKVKPTPLSPRNSNLG